MPKCISGFLLNWYAIILFYTTVINIEQKSWSFKTDFVDLDSEISLDRKRGYLNFS